MRNNPRLTDSKELLSIAERHTDQIMKHDDLLHTEKILADRKTFYLDLKENARGKVVKITEEVSGNRDTIMIPAEVLGDFIEALTDIQATSEGEN